MASSRPSTVVSGRARRTPGAADPRLERLQRLGYLLDASIRLPGGFRVGYDALLGLIPGAGDVVGLLLSGYIILQAARLGAPAPVLARMIANTGIETLAGAVPVVGDLFDAGWKANLRNLDLLHAHLGVPAPRRAPTLRRTAVTFGALALLAVLLVAALVYGLFRLFGGA